MKKRLLLAKPLFIVLLLAANFAILPAQRILYLNSNNVNAGIGVEGNLFTQYDSLSAGGRFESPKGSGIEAIFAQSLWITARDANDSLYCAANRYWDYGYDFFDGPIATTYDSIYDHYYKRVWKVTQQQIAQFRTLTFPTTANLVDTAILHWPGKGNPSVLGDFGVNINSALAPFVDVNGNGIYDPLQGDYPGICGDEGLFFVYNDARGPHTQSNGKALGIEIRGIANSYTDSTSVAPYAKRAINNTIFVQYEIENKSTVNYTSLDVANWVDEDLGCFDNDYVGCDTARSLMFAYNGTLMDPDCAPEKGYGTLPVALGIKMLNQPMNVFGYFTGQGASSPSVSDPITAPQYRNYCEGFWIDTVPFTVGGNGYNGVDPTKFIFPGDPNIANQWSEVQTHDVPGDRRMFGGTMHQTFNPGEIKHFDYAFFTSFDSSSDHFSIVDTLKRDADVINTFYYDNILPCQAQHVSGIAPVPNNNQFTVSIYPNPANNNITIESTDNIQTIQLMDIEGRVLLHKTVGATKALIPVSTLAKGVYLLNVQGVGTSVIRKIVVE